MFSSNQYYKPAIQAAPEKKSPRSQPASIQPTPAPAAPSPAIQKKPVVKIQPEKKKN